MEIIGQYNTKPIWDIRFTKIYEAIAEFVRQKPEWEFMMSMNLLG